MSRHHRPAITRTVSTVEPLRSFILAAARQDALRRLVSTTPGVRAVVARFVAGETVGDAVGVARRLVADGRRVTLDYLGENASDGDQIERNVTTYLRLLDELRARGLADRVEISVKLSAVAENGDEEQAVTNMNRICATAENAGTTVTVDMEDHTTTEATLRVLDTIRRRWPWVGAVLQSYLRRTEADTVTLSARGSRVRLCKGAYSEPAQVAYTNGHDIDLNYLRCADLLLRTGSYGMFATHDPRLIRIMEHRTRWYGRDQGSYEYQMLYGIRPDEQRRLTTEGETVRVYVPFGEQWYGYLMRRLAERPANLGFFLRALVSRS